MRCYWLWNIRTSCNDLVINRNSSNSIYWYNLLFMNWLLLDGTLAQSKHFFFFLIMTKYFIFILISDKKKYEIDFLVLEKSNDIGGLWYYREDDFGVMESTHINVSKYNYCYSDHSFDENVADFPHHSEMLNYIKSYARKYQLNKHILLNTQLLSIEGLI